MRRTGEQQRAYLSEIAIALKRQGFTVQTEDNGLLPVKWNGQPLCRISADGVVRYDSQTVSDFDLDDALAEATSVTMTVTEYMRLMEQAPDLKASGLESGFKLLGEFNDVVLACRMTRFGANFVTWNWDRDHSSVDNGHYFMENYKGAKQDLAVRSGLVRKEQIFTPEQLIEVYRSILDALESDHPITDARREILESVAVGIESIVPDVDERVYKSAQEDQELEGEQHGQTLLM